MSFWGLNVHPGIEEEINPGPRQLIKITKATLGHGHIAPDFLVTLTITFGNDTHVIGRLSQEKPQMKMDLIVNKKCSLSHDCASGIVSFTGVDVNPVPEEEGDWPWFLCQEKDCWIFKFLNEHGGRLGMMFVFGVYWNLSNKFSELIK